MASETWIMLYKAMAIGSVMGVLSALLGVGGGIVAVPAMVYLMGFDIKAAAGTSLAAMVAVSLSGAVKHYSQGNVHLATAGGIALTGVVFAMFGAWLSKMIPGLWLQRVFAVFLVCMAIQLFWRTLSAPSPAAPSAPRAEVAEEAPEKTER